MQTDGLEHVSQLLGHETHRFAERIYPGRQLEQRVLLEQSKHAAGQAWQVLVVASKKKPLEHEGLLTMNISRVFPWCMAAYVPVRSIEKLS